MMLRYNKIKNNRLVKNFVSLLILQGSNYLLPLITLPYLFKVLGADKFGLLAFASAVVLFLQVFVDYGFNLSGTREISVHSHNRAKLIEIFSSIMTIKAILLLFSFVLLTLLILFFEKFKSDFLIFYITFGIVVGEALFPRWFFQGMEEMKYITYINVSIKIFFTICIFIFVQESNDYYMVPLLNSIGFIIAGLFSLILIKNIFDIHFQIQKKSIIIRYLKESWNIFLTELMPNLYNNFSTLLLGFVTSMENVGYYSLATRIIGIFNGLLQIIKTVTFPYLNKDFSKFKIIAKIMIGSGFLLSVLIFSLASLVVPYIFGNSAVQSVTLIYILALSPLFASMLYTFGTNKLLILKRDREFKNITFVYSLFGFSSAIIFVPMFGIYGAAFTLIITRALMAYLTYIRAKDI